MFRNLLLGKKPNQFYISFISLNKTSYFSIVLHLYQTHSLLSSSSCLDGVSLESWVLSKNLIAYFLDACHFTVFIRNWWRTNFFVSTNYERVPFYLFFVSTQSRILCRQIMKEYHLICYLCRHNKGCFFYLSQICVFEQLFVDRIWCHLLLCRQIMT